MKKLVLLAALAVSSVTAMAQAPVADPLSHLLYSGLQVRGSYGLLSQDIKDQRVMGQTPLTVGQMVPNYLSEVPSGWNPSTPLSQKVLVTKAALTEAQCAEVNRQAKHTAAVSKSDRKVSFGCDATDLKGFVNLDPEK